LLGELPVARLLVLVEERLLVLVGGLVLHHL
jgi:hypothetical protein